MADAQEIIDRKRVIILLAAGETAALAMNSEALDAAVTQLLINQTAASYSPENFDHAESFFAGMEAALFAEAHSRLTDKGVGKP